MFVSGRLPLQIAALQNLRYAFAFGALLALPGCFTAAVQEELWEPDPVDEEPVEFALVDIDGVAVGADGRLFIQARGLTSFEGSGEASDSGPSNRGTDRGELRLYCPEPSSRELAGASEDASLFWDGLRPPGPRAQLSAAQVCFAEPAAGSLRSLRRLTLDQKSRRYFPDLGLGIDLNFPQAAARVFRIAGDFDARPFRGDSVVEAYLKRVPNYDRNELYIVARDSGDFLRLRIHRKAGLWEVVQQAAGFYEDNLDREGLEAQAVSRLAPGAVVLVRRENLVDGDPGGRFRETAGVYAAVAEGVDASQKLAREWGAEAAPMNPVIEISLVSSVTYRSRFHPGHLVLNALAIPLFPLAVVGDILFIPVYVTSAVCLVDEGLTEAGGAAADGVLRSCLK